MTVPRHDPLAGLTCEQIHPSLSNVRCGKCGQLIPLKPSRRQATTHRPVWVGPAPRSSQPPPINHALHIGLCILTFGVWVLPYAVILVYRGWQRSSYQRYQRGVP